MEQAKRLVLCFGALWLIAGAVLTVSGAKSERPEDYDTKIAAAHLMGEWMDTIKAMKLQAGLELTEEDLHGTGLMGERYTFITTTLGDPAAKRTTCNPDMAALLVELLGEAGVRPGDTVGAGFSGSFPAMNLAVLAACQTLDVKCVYIASVGASTYGANQPELTFPDMVCRLHQEGLLEWAPSLITPGGDYDCGTEMDPELRKQVLSRIRGYGVRIMEEPDFKQNLSARMERYEVEGPIKCFIGVGGNISTLGLEDEDIPCGVIPAGTIQDVSDRSGLLQLYNAQGLPVIYLLNIKELMAEHGLTFDPEQLLPPGESSIYYETAYPKWGAVIGLAGAIATIWLGFRRLRRED
ncbi:MAG: poly-gamma-glutamate system protein [Lawsonibacter sp.]|nr:poly-gamma-glutamate system protein [Lawsonibacter sp.]